MVEEIRWSAEAVKEWAKDLFASRDEAAKIARSEALELRDGLRREADREVNRIDERIDREVHVRDQRLADLDRDMERRLTEEREFRDEVVGQALTRETYEREHRALQVNTNTAIDQLEKRLSHVENTLANLTGRAVVFAVLGAIFLATVTAFISHVLNV